MIELGRNLRGLGEPHPGARAWTLAARSVDRAEAMKRLERWLASLPPGPMRRCGVASVQDSERGEAIAVVTVPVFAVLRRAIPGHVRQGAWITIDATVRARANGAKVVVLGPRGAPRGIPTSFDSRTRRIVARFMVDQAGAWLVQVLATTDSGPRPVLEAAVSVGDAVKPSRPDVVPGILAGQRYSDPADALTAMLGEARHDEGLPPLLRDPVLDRVALEHVRRMMQAGLVAHDVGDGTPPDRVAEAGVTAGEVGENVSRAATPALAHRSLWESPSHRRNLLHERYRRVGVAALRDARGEVWAAQVFTD